VVSNPELESSEEWMTYWSLIHILIFFLDFFTLMGTLNRDKALEIIILRQQVRILRHKVKTPPPITDPDRMILAILTDRYKQSTDDARQRLHQVMLIFQAAFRFGFWLWIELLHHTGKEEGILSHSFFA
jgi:hypothetical protein